MKLETSLKRNEARTKKFVPALNYNVEEASSGSSSAGVICGVMAAAFVIAGTIITSRA